MHSSVSVSVTLPVYLLLSLFICYFFSVLAYYRFCLSRHVSSVDFFIHPLITTFWLSVSVSVSLFTWRLFSFPDSYCLPSHSSVNLYIHPLILLFFLLIFVLIVLILLTCANLIKSLNVKMRVQVLGCIHVWREGIHECVMYVVRMCVAMWEWALIILMKKGKTMNVLLFSLCANFVLYVSSSHSWLWISRKRDCRDNI